MPETSCGWADLVPIQYTDEDLNRRFVKALNTAIDMYWIEYDDGKFKEQSDFFNRTYSWGVALAKWITLFEEVHKTPMNKHFSYLRDLNINPQVIYDIGACGMGWTGQAKQIWPDAEYVLFDAADNHGPQYEEAGYQHHVGALSDVSGKTVRFYQNDLNCTGNSYYREINHDVFPESTARDLETCTLDQIVKDKGFKPANLIKIDVQGSELDVLLGAKEVIASCSDVVVELRHTPYNEGAPEAPEVIRFLEGMGFVNKGEFYNNGPDGDYHFTRL